MKSMFHFVKKKIQILFNVTFFLLLSVMKMHLKETQKDVLSLLTRRWLQSLSICFITEFKKEMINKLSAEFPSQHNLETTVAIVIVCHVV